MLLKQSLSTKLELAIFTREGLAVSLHKKVEEEITRTVEHSPTV